MRFFQDNPSAELINTYLCFIEKKFNLQPVLFPKDKVIYSSADELITKLEKEGQLWHETEIKIGYSEEDVYKIWGGNFLRVMRAVERK